MKNFMGKLINPHQHACIPRRSITDNIMLCNNPLKGFHLNRGSPKMLLKHDISKAFDWLKWDFIVAPLKALQFPMIFINWITEFIKKSAFSVLINDKACGYFNSTWGLREGCPLSPNLLCIAMEFFFSNPFGLCGSYPLQPHIPTFYSLMMWQVFFSWGCYRRKHKKAAWRPWDSPRSEYQLWE